MNESADEDWDGLSTGQKLNRFLEKNPDATPSEIKQFADKYNINVSFSWSDDAVYDAEEVDSGKFVYTGEEAESLIDLLRKSPGMEFQGF